MKKLLALLLSVIMIFALVACADLGGDDDTDGTTPPDARKGGHLDIVSTNINATYDGASVGGVYHWPNLIYECPLSRNADGSVAPGVCDFELSEDQLTLKLWVREGMTFHDGSPVEIEDVVASMLRRGHKSPTTYVVEYIEDGYPQVDANGVATFKFKKYSEKTMYYIASTKPLHAVYTKEFCEEFPGITADGNVYNHEYAKAIGTGPYKIDSARDNEWRKFVRYENYVQPDASLTGAAGPKMSYFDSITFHALGDSSAAAIRLMSHELDVYMATLEDFQDQFEMNDLKQTKQTGTKTYFLLFNNRNQENQVHDDINLRKAICAAIDFEELNAEMWGDGYNLSGTPALDGAYYLDTWEKADYMGAANVTLAQQYLAESNYKDGDKVYYIGTDANLAALLETYLNAAGIEMQIDIKDSTEVDNRVCDGEAYWNFTFWPFTAGNSPSTISSNAYDRGWQNEDKDDLYDTLCNTIPGSAEYMKAWEDMADMWVDECVTVYVGQQYATWTHHEDLVVDYTGSDIYIWNWYWKNPSEHAE